MLDGRRKGQGRHAAIPAALVLLLGLVSAASGDECREYDKIRCVFTVMPAAASLGGLGATVVVTGEDAAPLGSALMAVGCGLFSSYSSRLNRELVHRVKLDLEAWRAGGESSPLLAGVVRELRLSGFFGPAAGGRELHVLGEAIDRLVVQAEAGVEP